MNYRKYFSVFTLALMLLAGVMYPVMAVVTWDNGGGDSRWATDANWSGDADPGITDTCYFDSTVSEAACSAFTDINVGYIWVKNGWTGTLYGAPGQIANLSFGIVDSGNGGYRNYPAWTKIRLDSASSVFKFAATLPTIVGSTSPICTLRVEKSAVFTDNKGVVMIIKMANSSQIIGNGANIWARSAGTVPALTMGNNCKISYNSPTILQIIRYTNGQKISSGTSDTVANGTGAIQFSNTGTIIDTLNGLGVLFTGSGSVTIGANGVTNATTVISNFSYPNGPVTLSNVTQNEIFKVSNCKFKNLILASTSATAGKYTYTYLYDSDTIGITGLTATTTGPDTLSLGTVNLYNAGPHTPTLGANWVVLPGTSSYVMNGTTAQTWKDTNHYYDVTIPDTAGSVVCSSKVFIDGDLDADKTLRLAAGMECAGDFSADSAGTTPDTLQVADTLRMNGASSNLHIGIGSVVSAANATLRLTGAAPTVDLDANAAFSKLSHGSTTVSTFTGTGKSSFVTGPTMGAMVINQTGTTAQGATTIDSIRITAGTDSLSGKMTVNETVNHTGGNLKMGGQNVSAKNFKSTGGKLYARMALDTLTVSGDSCIMTATDTTESLTVSISTITNFKQGTLTIKRLLHSAAAAFTKFCGTGTISISNSPTQGSVQSIAAGTVNFLSKVKLDSLILNPGTATLAGAGDDSIGYGYIAGTLNSSGDEVAWLGDLTFTAAATHTTDASTIYKFSKNGAILTTAGKAQPALRFFNNYRINDGCTISRLTWSVDGKAGTFEAGETFTLTNLAAADWNGAAGSLNALRSSVNGTAYEIIIPNAAVCEYLNPRDCRLTGFTVTCNNCETEGGNY